MIRLSYELGLQLLRTMNLRNKIIKIISQVFLILIITLSFYTHNSILIRYNNYIKGPAQSFLVTLYLKRSMHIALF